MITGASVVGASIALHYTITSEEWRPYIWAGLWAGTLLRYPSAIAVEYFGVHAAIYFSGAIMDWWMLSKTF